MTLVLALLACAPTQADHGRSFTAAMSAQADLSRPEAPVVLTGREAEALRIGVGQTAPAATKDGTSAAAPAAARPTSP
jgi:hypothetical protein